MKRLSHLALLFVLGGMLRPVQAQTVCRAADSTSAALILELGRYSSATSGDDKAMRDTLRLPLTSASDVVLVTKETTCQKANTAYQTAVNGSGGTGLSGRVYVVKVGNVYAALDPTYNAGEPGSWTVIILDARFKELSSY
jgi:hypothetical protein